MGIGGEGFVRIEFVRVLDSDTDKDILKEGIILLLGLRTALIYIDKGYRSKLSYIIMFDIKTIFEDLNKYCNDRSEIENKVLFEFLEKSIIVTNSLRLQPIYSKLMKQLDKQLNERNGKIFANEKKYYTVESIVRSCISLPDDCIINENDDAEKKEKVTKHLRDIICIVVNYITTNGNTLFREQEDYNQYTMTFSVQPVYKDSPFPNNDFDESIEIQHMDNNPEKLTDHIIEFNLRMDYKFIFETEISKQIKDYIVKFKHIIKSLCKEHCNKSEFENKVIDKVKKANTHLNTQNRELLIRILFNEQYNFEEIFISVRNEYKYNCNIIFNFREEEIIKYTICECEDLDNIN